VWALIAGLSAKALIGTALFLRVGGGLVRPTSVSAARAVVRRSITFHIPSVVTSGAFFVGAALVSTQLNADELGLWAWSTVLATPVLGLVLALQTIMGPSLAAMGAGSAARGRDAASLAGRVAVLLTAGACGVLFGGAEPLIRHVFGAHWVPAVDAARAALLAPILGAFVLTLAPTLETTGRQRTRMWASTAGALAACVAAAPLAAAAGIAGATTATSVAAALVEVLVLGATAGVRVGRGVVDGVVVFAVGVLVTGLVAGSGVGVGEMVVGLAAGGLAAVAAALVVDLAALRRLVELRPRRVGVEAG
jgi:PST family polysaccharide transporter